MLGITVMLDYQSNQIAALAREMAMAIRQPPAILAQFAITQEEFEQIQTLDYYKRCYESFVMEWESAGSTNRRIAIQSAAALEQALPGLAAQMIDSKQPATARNELAKTFAKLAGAGEQKREEASAEKFKIIINLGADRQVFDEKIVRPSVDVVPLTITESTSPVASTDSPLPKNP
jgi:hypothetical protein